MNKYANYIKKKLDERILCEQLAEECSELSKASLKVIRANGYSDNYTPTNPITAMENFLEEIEDVLAVMFLIMEEDTYNSITGNVNENPKWERWAKRLGYKEVDGAVVDSLTEKLEALR